MTQAASITCTAMARAPGSCGELAQGMLDGNYFLVSCPIDMYSTATVEISPGSGRVTAPPDAPKSRRAVELALARSGRRDVDAHLGLSSPIPRGKGMASSTADISASIAATASAVRPDAEISPDEIASIALQIEPSDSVMLPGIALLDHKSGSMMRTLGAPPPMRVVVLDFGGNVDTLAFNGVNRDRALSRLEAQFGEALSLVEAGIRAGNPEAIGEGATLSAVANQQLLYKPQLDTVLRLAEEVGAVGVNAAHSGTVLGMLFEDDDSLAENAVSRAWNSLFGIRRIYNRRIVSGGVTHLEAPNASKEASLWRR